MASLEPSRANAKSGEVNASSRKPRIILAASGSVAALKFAVLCHSFSDWAEVRAVATATSLHFIDIEAIPKDVILYTDKDEWYNWRRLGGNVLHIELCKWADIMVIAPLSANSLAKVIKLRNCEIFFCLVDYVYGMMKPLLMFHGNQGTLLTVVYDMMF